jgi:hypothetical protein
MFGNSFFCPFLIIFGLKNPCPGIKNRCVYRGVIRISTQPRQKYKILTGRKNCFLYTLLISHKRLFHTGTAKNPVYLRSFLLGKIIKIVISSNLQRRPSIFKEYFAWKKNKDFFIQICQAVWAISYSLLYVVSKINQGSCLGCLGGDDAPGTLPLTNL